MCMRPQQTYMNSTIQPCSWRVLTIIFIGKIYCPHLSYDIKFNSASKEANVTWTRKVLDFALWARLDGEMEESASHHLSIIICFAQLRAEIAKTDAGEARRITRSSEIWILGDLGKSTFLHARTANVYELYDSTSFLKSFDDHLHRQNLLPLPFLW